jgi:pseudaminic acid cytidylyltransferase
MNIAIIPARKGSKRIPLKNIKDFNGIPMIKWSIEKAKKSGIFDSIYVSSDSEDILSYVETLGAIALPKRIDSLSGDATPTAPVIKQAIIDTGLEIDLIETVCCIYPCAPFIFISDLKIAHNKIKNEKLNFVYPITEYSHPIQRAIKLVDGTPVFREEEFELTPTQLLETNYHDTGQFYFGTPSAWLSNLKMHTDGGAMEIPNWRAVDIDNMTDWIRAELLFQLLSKDYSEEL